MARMWIVVGDITSSGGRVITGSAETDIDGKGVARVHDKATCPLHKGVFPIVDGDPTIIIDGQPVALHGSKLACGCTVLTTQQSHVFVDNGSARSGGAGAAKAVAAAGASAAFAGDAPGGAGATNSEVMRMTEADRRSGYASGGRLRTGSVLKVLCPKDKAVVDELAKTDVRVADEVVFDDQYYDGSQWTTRRFEAGGIQDPSNNRIVLLNGTPPESAATTLYHEVHHKGQDGSVLWKDREIEAYTRTEQWAIDRGLPGQGGLRKQVGDGRWVPDGDAIRRVVGDYPISETRQGESPALRKLPDGNVLLQDGSTRAPRRGDAFPAKVPTITGERSIPSSAWKCPGVPENGPAAAPGP